ncbi:hypothetical protein [Mycolicibacterium monacense]
MQDLPDRPHHRHRRERAPDVLGNTQPPPACLFECENRFAQRIGDDDLVGGGVEPDRVSVGLHVGFGQWAFGKADNLFEDVAHRLGVEIAVTAVVEQSVNTEDLEKVELDISDVGAEVCHLRAFC